MKHIEKKNFRSNKLDVILLQMIQTCKQIMIEYLLALKRVILILQLYKKT